ncbi:MAG: class IV adenylate cyclase [Planctomycetota bacterium]|nr:class IV adenylate cyclase [Planctomycetaceae bacterium]MDQ3330685.1 class IV adenylate cyclase [Planctomycetota bacterium]
MIEVELKFRTDDVSRVRQQVKEMGGLSEQVIEQVDTYFAHPVRDFAMSDEALRIRVVGDRACVTYKGPLLDQATKSREETEIWFTGGSNDEAGFASMLESLSFRPVRIVKKRREPWSLRWQERDVEVAIDAVDGLGDFVELETAATKEDFESAKAILLSLADVLSLSDSERRSYLAMLLAGDEA